MELNFLLELIVERRFHKAHEMFQKDAQTITPEALENVKAALASSEIEHKTEAKKRAIPRKAARSLVDPTLSECLENDYRQFCGDDIGNEVNDDVLSKAFARFPTFNMAKVVLALVLFTFCLASGAATSTPVRTIKSPDGDLIDCVERTAQPAFSHPLLKNHKLQETPTNLANLANSESEVSWQIWHGSRIKCPEGTIPIRNKYTTTEAGLEATFGHEYAIGTMESPPPKIYGAKVTMNVWHPIVERPEEFSLGQGWLVSGSYKTNDLNTIEAGWQDQKQGLWWLGVGLNNGTVLAPVGYWPKEIFTRLSDYAKNVQWGGEIVNQNISGCHTRTQMGSGYLPESAKAAYMRDLEITLNETNFQPVYNLAVGSSNTTYYRIKKFSNTSFSYGGPQHAGAVYLRSNFILIYISFILFLFF